MNALPLKIMEEIEAWWDPLSAKRTTGYFHCRKEDWQRLKYEVTKLEDRVRELEGTEMTETDELLRRQDEDDARLEQAARNRKDVPLSVDATPQEDGLAINVRVRHEEYGKGAVYDIGPQFVAVQFDSGRRLYLPRKDVTPAIERSGTG